MTPHDRAYTFTGWDDPDIDVLGKDQVGAAARRWESGAFDPVWAAVPAAEGARSLS